MNHHWMNKDMQTLNANSFGWLWQSMRYLFPLVKVDFITTIATFHFQPCTYVCMFYLQGPPPKKTGTLLEKSNPKVGPKVSLKHEPGYSKLTRGFLSGILFEAAGDLHLRNQRNTGLRKTLDNAHVFSLSTFIPGS